MSSESIDRLAARIRELETVDGDTKAELERLLAELKAEMAELALTRQDEAESIAGFVQVSTHEATRRTTSPPLLSHALDGLRTSVSEFETSHPALTSAANALANLLSGLGV